MTSTARFCAALVAFATAPLLAGGCGGTHQTALAALASNQNAYFGKRVDTSGVVERQTNVNGSSYYVLTDQAQNLVILEPDRIARRYTNHLVTVEGRFGFNPHQGREIRIEQIRVKH